MLKVKIVKGLKFELNRNKWFDILEFMDSLDYVVNSLRKYENKDIYERNVDEILKLCNRVEQLYNDKLCDYIGINAYCIDYESIQSKAQKVYNKLAEADQREREALERWYWSTRL